ncbi:hypothetical protein BDZ91DRAFT_691623 [Kalaharituber pfeilii]|nr:hypothetical protein BDZ91DRAFT_691623 [Kalaharituber pfeilii]
MSTRPPANPKRGPTYSAPGDSSTSASRQSKRPKFDPRNPSTLSVDASDSSRAGGTLDDAVLDLDSVGAGGRKVKRGAVKLEGYESDSSNEGYERKVDKPRREQAKDDDDMFGGRDDDDDDEEESGGAKTRLKNGKKEVRFLELDEIEGQEFDNEAEHVHLDDRKGKGKPGEPDSESDSSDAEDTVQKSLENLDPELGLGSLKRHAPKLDAFNMRSEMEEGRFDAAGNFIRNAVDVDAVHDSWLEGVSRRDMRKAREAHERREQEMRKRMVAEDEVLTSDMLSTLISGLETGETILEALARIGQERKRKKVPKWKLRRKAGNHTVTSDNMDVVNGSKEPPPPESSSPAQALDRYYKTLIERLTGAADLLLSRGDLEIYDATRELLMRQYRRETGEDWRPPEPGSPPPANPSSSSSSSPSTAETKWEYKWLDGRDGGTVYGPYSSAEMAAWNVAGFFAGAGIEFRKVFVGGMVWRGRGGRGWRGMRGMR